MIYIHIENRHASIRGLTPRITKILEKRTSYLVSGFMFAPSFKNKRWDGREHLMTFSPRRGYKIPSGLVGDIVDELKLCNKRYKITYDYNVNGPKVNYKWNPNVILRDYQNDAVEAVCTGKKWQRGSGLLKMPIRSGKTKTAARIIYTMQRRTLFIVPSQQLLHQTKQSLEESLMCKVGLIGDGFWDIRDLTVSTIQTLAIHARGGSEKPKDGSKKGKGGSKKRVTLHPDEKFKSISNFFDFIIFDETHRLVADTWHAIVSGFDCRYKLGLSASIHFDNDRECERGVIWLRACCGDVRYEVKTDLLVEQGHLMKQNVELILQTEPAGYENWGWGQELQKVLIYENEHRNRKIIEKAIEKNNEGLKVLIVSNRINQLHELHLMLEAKNIGHAVVTGSSKTNERKAKVEAFVTGEIDILMGTVFSEGVDIPEIECVINADCGYDIKSAIQKMRNLTPHDGKKTAVYIDIMDLTNKYFANHSRERLNIYKNEKSFTIKVVK